jgi:enoyl-CoA hydratase/carnithine racemase
MSIEPFPLERETSGPAAGIAVLRLDQPGKPVVVLDHDLIRRIEATMLAIPAGTRGLVLASASERVFIAGADLKAISEWDDDQLDRYLAYGAKVFGMFSNCPFPTVAAINGAALGGGLEIAMHCDGLVACPPPTKDGQPGRPYPVGLPEAGLGLCPGWGGTNLLPALIDPFEAIPRTCSGTPLLFNEAENEGLFDAIANIPAVLVDTAKRWLVDVGSKLDKRTPISDPWKKPRATGPGGAARAASAVKALDALRQDLPKTEAAAAVVDALDAGLTRGYAAALDTERRHLVRLRHTPAAKDALAAFFAKSKK